ncbi:MAG TPA: nitroreductase family protein [Ktedonobacteraceae bacterium]|nr:nitroreductase family protein [Ktedonobacteraceae bacterium]
MPQLIANPLDVVEADFPGTGTLVEQIHFMLNYAVLAPSRHNVQPWLFKVEGNTVELYADQSRALPVADADNREMIISCGAALANFLIASRHFGYAPVVELAPALDSRYMLARISLEKGVVATEEEQKLFRAIMQRRTNRQLFKDRAVPLSLLAALEAIAGRQGTIFQVIYQEEVRYAVASLIATGDRLLWADERFRQEIAEWTRPADSQSRDGVPAYALGKGDMAAYLGPLKIRTFMDSEEADAGHRMAVGSPVLAVLGTFTDTWFDWLATGQALERILLYARSAGVWASFFSQPVEVATLRMDLRDILEQTGFPQLVLRMGYGSDVPPTPRRGVRDVLL